MAGKGSKIRKMVDWKRYFANAEEILKNPEFTTRSVKRIIKKNNKSTYVY